MTEASARRAPALHQGRLIDELVVPVADHAVRDRALPVAAQLAEAWNVPIRLVHVSESIGSQDPDLEPILERARPWFPQVTIEAEHLHGSSPAPTIADRLGPNSLAVVSTDHSDEWRIKGSVAETLVTVAGTPLLLVGKGAGRHDGHGAVVVGVDGSAGSDSSVEAAVEFARSLDRSLWMIRVDPVPGPDDQPDSQPGTTNLQALAERFDPEVHTRWEVVQANDPVQAIGSFAARRHAAFLVVGSRGRDDQTRRSMGSISMGLVSTAGRPVLILKKPRSPEPHG